MQNHPQTTNTGNTLSEMKSEQRHEARQLQRVDVLDLQQVIIANQMVPIVHKTGPGNGVPFSALND